MLGFPGSRRLALAALAAATVIAPAAASAAPITFLPRADYTLSDWDPGRIATGDLNGDAIPDVVVVGTSDDRRMYVLLNKGDGSGQLQPSVDYPIATTGFLSGVAIGDVNDDGQNDIVASSSGGSDAGLWTLLGNGNGTFQTPAIHSATYGGAVSVALGKLDGNGTLDAAVGDSPPGADPARVEILRGLGNGSFSPPANCNTGIPSDCYGFDNTYGRGDFTGVVDLDRDGKLDVVVASEACGFNAGVIGVLKGKGDGTFQTVQTYLGGHCPQDPAIADLDSSGSLDMATTTGVVLSHHHDISSLLGGGGGTFSAGPSASRSQDLGQPVSADFDGDGKPDLAATSGTQILVAPGHGDGSFQVGQYFPAVAVGGYGGFGGIATDDLNGDGKPDLVLSCGRSIGVSCVAYADHQTGLDTGFVSVLLNTTPFPTSPPPGGGGLPTVSPYAGCRWNGQGLDLFAQGIEVTQAVQTIAFPDTAEGCFSAPGFLGLHPGASYPSGAFFNGDGTARYVGLVAGRKTVVRVYADMSGAIGLSPFVTARLYGYRNGRLIAGNHFVRPNPQLADNGQRRLSLGLPDIAYSQRTDPGGAFEFTIPDEWTKGGDLTLVAELNPVGASPHVAECPAAACQGDDVFTLRGIHFTPTRPFDVKAVAMPVGGERLPAPDGVFGDLASVLPVADGDLSLSPVYAGTIGLTDSTGCDAAGYLLPAVEHWGATQHFHGGGSVNRAVGVYAGTHHCGDSSQTGSTTPHVGYGGASLPSYPYSVVAANREMTSVAHEIFHGLGQAHAGPRCPTDGVHGGLTSGAPIDKADANANPSEGSDWAPDQQGFLQGIGLDVNRYAGTGFGHRTIATTAFPSAAIPANRQVYDFMSYCVANLTVGSSDYSIWEDQSWVSPRTWDTVLQKLALRSVGRAVARPTAAASGASLEVLASVQAGGVRVSSVRPAPPGPALSGGLSAYKVAALDGAGHIVSVASMTASGGHSGFGPDFEILRGTLPRSGAIRSVRVLLNGRVVAQRARTAHAPQVTVAVPRRGRRAVTVRWRARDRDRDPLLATVEYSATGTGRWRTLFIGASRGRVALPAGLLARAPHARVRVSIDDGFDQATALSRRFQSLGAPPTVTIHSPARGERIMDDASLFLAGAADDDAGRALRGARLRWFAGRTLLGTGAELSASALPPGSRTIALVARDRYGRAGRASVKVRVVADRPQLTVLRVPASLGRRARRLRLAVAAALPSRLTISGRGVTRRRVDVDRVVRQLTVRVRPGTAPLRLVLDLAARGRRARTVVAVTRS